MDTKTACSVHPICFNCEATDHVVDFYPIKKDTQQLAQFIGSAASRLGFYHVDIPDTHTDTSSVHNVRLVLDDWNFLVKFLPHTRCLGNQALACPRRGAMSKCKCGKGAWTTKLSWKKFGSS
jgi:hypothetical protein